MLGRRCLILQALFRETVDMLDSAPAMRVEQEEPPLRTYQRHACEETKLPQAPTRVTRAMVQREQQTEAINAVRAIAQQPQNLAAQDIDQDPGNVSKANVRPDSSH